MARELTFRNGRPRPKREDVHRCEECGKPVHPSLTCVCRGHDDE